MDIWFNQLISQAMAALSSGNAAALAALFLVVILTEAGVPFPFILDSAIFLSVYEHGPLSIKVLRVILVVFLGRQAGAAAVYWLARSLGSAITNWLAEHFQSVNNGLTSLRSRLNNRAFLVVAMSRLTSLLTLSSLASGVIHVRFRSFSMGVALSAVIFDGSLVLLGFIMRRWLWSIGLSPSPSLVVLGLVFVIVLVWAIRFLVSRRKRSKP